MISWYCYSFDDIPKVDLYDLLALRTTVFVVEQNCPYQELDGKDKVSYHLIGKDKQGEIIACARLVPSGFSYEEASIGRIATAKKIRNKGYGHLLVQKAIEEAIKAFQPGSIRISAQEHLKGFYEKQGFKVITETYLEDNIPHVGMKLEMSPSE